MSKTCSKCGLEKPLTEFSINKQNHNRPMSWCKQCRRDEGSRSRNTAAGIYQQIKAQIKYAKKHGETRTSKGRLRCKRKVLDCTQDEFVKWYNSQPKVCGYCGIKKESLNLVSDAYNRNLTRLSVDAIDNDKDYSIDNIILSCRRCNATKSDFFSHDEMVEIGKIIRNHWEQKS